MTGDRDLRIAELAEKASHLITPLVDDAEDCLLVISTMAASMAKALALTDIGYCSSSAMCMHIDYALKILKRLHELEHDAKPKPSTMPLRRDI